MMPRIARISIAAVLLVSVLLTGSLGFALTPQTAHAQVGTAENIVGDFSGCLAGVLADLAISAIIGFFFSTVPTADIPVQLKENVKDCLAWSIGNAAIEFMTQEILEWANSGFDGNPAYVQDLKRHFANVAKNRIGEFIQETQELAFLCEPFQRQVITSIALTFDTQGASAYHNRAACTLDDVLRNTEDFEAFVNGDFSRGGWVGWLELTQRPQNNPYGAYYLASVEVQQRVNADIAVEERNIRDGRGFLAKPACYAYEKCAVFEELGPNDIGPPACIEFETTVLSKGIAPTDIPEGHRCIDERTVTPGSIIQESIQKNLGLNVDRIIQVDELNEAISILFVGLFNELLSGVEGLFGSGDFVNESAGFIDAESGQPLVPPGNGGGSSADWACLHDLGAVAASDTITANLGDYTGTGGTAFGEALRIPGTEINRFYKSATFEFDMTIDRFTASHPEFTAFADFARNRIIGTYAGYWGTGIAHNNGMRTYLDRHGAEYDAFTASWEEGETYHITITHDAEAGSVSVESDAGHNHTFAYTRGVDIADTGDGLILWLPQALGGTFEDITVTLEPGGPFHGGVRGPCEGGSAPTEPPPSF